MTRCFSVATRSVAEGRQFCRRWGYSRQTSPPAVGPTKKFFRRRTGIIRAEDRDSERALSGVDHFPARCSWSALTHRSPALREPLCVSAHVLHPVGQPVGHVYRGNHVASGTPGLQNHATAGTARRFSDTPPWTYRVVRQDLTIDSSYSIFIGKHHSSRDSAKVPALLL